MNALVTFDQQGAMGPAATLLFRASSYNKQELDEVTNLLKKNFSNMAEFKPKGRKEFCAQILSGKESSHTVSKVEIINSRFFQSMKSQTPSSCHDDVVTTLAPFTLEMNMKYIEGASIDDSEKNAVTTWIATFLESYVSDKELKSTIDTMKADKENANIQGKRAEIGMKLYKNVQSKKFTKENFDELIELLEHIQMNLQAAQNSALYLSSVDYVTSSLGDYVPIDTVDANLVQETVKFLMDKGHLKENDAHVTTIFWDYVHLFQMSKRPELLGHDIISKLKGPFKQKFFPEGK